MENIINLLTNSNLKSVSNSTGIPYDRMYKWLKGKGMPKTADYNTLTQYFNGILSNNEKEGEVSDIINCNDNFTPEKLTNTLNEQNEQIEKFVNAEKSRRLDTPTKKPDDNMLAIVSDTSDELPGGFGNSIPIYDAPLAQLANKNQFSRFAVAYINHPVFAGCDAVMRAKGDRMQPHIDEGFLMGVKQIDWQTYYQKGSIYNILTKQFEMLAYVHAISDDGFLRLTYANDMYGMEDLPKDQVLSMWHVKLAVPAGNPRTFN